MPLLSFLYDNGDEETIPSFSVRIGRESDFSIAATIEGRIESPDSSGRTILRIVYDGINYDAESLDVDWRQLNPEGIPSGDGELTLVTDIRGRVVLTTAPLMRQFKASFSRQLVEFMSQDVRLATHLGFSTWENLGELAELGVEFEGETQWRPGGDENHIAWEFLTTVLDANSIAEVDAALREQCLRAVVEPPRDPDYKAGFIRLAPRYNPTSFTGDYSAPPTPIHVTTGGDTGIHEPFVLEEGWDEAVYNGDPQNFYALTREQRRTVSNSGRVDQVLGELNRLGPLSIPNARQMDISFARYQEAVNSLAVPKSQREAVAAFDSWAEHVTFLEEVRDILLGGFTQPTPLWHSYNTPDVNDDARRIFARATDPNDPNRVVSRPSWWDLFLDRIVTLRDSNDRGINRHSVPARDLHNSIVVFANAFASLLSSHRRIDFELGMMHYGADSDGSVEYNQWDPTEWPGSYERLVADGTGENSLSEFRRRLSSAIEAWNGLKEAWIKTADALRALVTGEVEERDRLSKVVVKFRQGLDELYYPRQFDQAVAEILDKVHINITHASIGYDNHILNRKLDSHYIEVSCHLPDDRPLQLHSWVQWDGHNYYLIGYSQEDDAAETVFTLKLQDLDVIVDGDLAITSALTPYTTDVEKIPDSDWRVVDASLIGRTGLPDEHSIVDLAYHRSEEGSGVSRGLYGISLSARPWDLVEGRFLEGTALYNGQVGDLDQRGVTIFELDHIRNGRARPISGWTEDRSTETTFQHQNGLYGAYRLNYDELYQERDGISSYPGGTTSAGLYSDGLDLWVRSVHPSVPIEHVISSTLLISLGITVAVMAAVALTAGAAVAIVIPAGASVAFTSAGVGVFIGSTFTGTMLSVVTASTAVYFIIGTASILVPLLGIASFGASIYFGAGWTAATGQFFLDTAIKSDTFHTRANYLNPDLGIEDRVARPARASTSRPTDYYTGPGETTGKITGIQSCSETFTSTYGLSRNATNSIVNGTHDGVVLGTDDDNWKRATIGHAEYLRDNLQTENWLNSNGARQAATYPFPVQMEDLPGTNQHVIGKILREVSHGNFEYQLYEIRPRSGQTPIRRIRGLENYGLEMGPLGGMAINPDSGPDYTMWVLDKEGQLWKLTLRRDT